MKRTLITLLSMTLLFSAVAGMSPTFAFDTSDAGGGSSGFDFDDGDEIASPPEQISGAF